MEGAPDENLEYFSRLARQSFADFVMFCAAAFSGINTIDLKQGVMRSSAKGDVSMCISLRYFLQCVPGYLGVMHGWAGVCAGEGCDRICSLHAGVITDDGFLMCTLCEDVSGQRRMPRRDMRSTDRLLKFLETYWMIQNLIRLVPELSTMYTERIAEDNISVDKLLDNNMHLIGASVCTLFGPVFDYTLPECSNLYGESIWKMKLLLRDMLELVSTNLGMHPSKYLATSLRVIPRGMEIRRLSYEEYVQVMMCVALECGYPQFMQMIGEVPTARFVWGVDTSVIGNLVGQLIRRNSSDTQHERRFDFGNVVYLPCLHQYKLTDFVEEYGSKCPGERCRGRTPIIDVKIRVIGCPYSDGVVESLCKATIELMTCHHNFLSTVHGTGLSIEGMQDIMNSSNVSDVQRLVVRAIMYVVHNYAKTNPPQRLSKYDLIRILGEMSEAGSMLLSMMPPKDPEPDVEYGIGGDSE